MSEKKNLDQVQPRNRRSSKGKAPEIHRESTLFEELVPQQATPDQQQLSPTATSFDPRRIKRDSKSLEYSEERTLRNQILCAASELYPSPDAAQGIADLHSDFAVLVGGEFGVFRADLYIFEHEGYVWGVPAATRVGALRMLLTRLTDHLENWQCNKALAGE